ncbi:MAG: DNA damage-inducible protein D [Christensenellaceae bacterium]|jgi:DNA-damage-inducible protein D|nr:DNA damage-inducible protein D [Christensenellaceae bacterium]
MTKEIEKQKQSLESIKRIDDREEEYWTARELAPILGYNKWQNFQKVIDRAMVSCQNSGVDIFNHFREVTKAIEMPLTVNDKKKKNGFTDVSKTDKKYKNVIDYELSRYACYLIVQNGDPRKPVIAFGQTYFAVQTRRQELNDNYNNLTEDNKRLETRNSIKQWNQLLAEAAHNSGVITDIEYAEFQNAGYAGLYGGETVADIHNRKGLKENEKILDFMSSPELIANLFRISQTEEKLKNDRVATKEQATATHGEVGEKVRKAIKDIGGTLPENMPTPEKSAQQIAKEQIRRIKRLGRQGKLMLDE